jgi:hypothetical protein
MATLTDTTISSTYTLLLKIDSSGVDSTLRKVEDGDATDSSLSISTTAIAIDATDKLYLDGGGDTYIQESATDHVDFVVGASTMLSLRETGTNSAWMTGVNVGVGAGFSASSLPITSEAFGLEVRAVAPSSSTNGACIRLTCDDEAAMGNGHRLGHIEFFGAEDGSGTLKEGARIEAVTDAAWSSTENGASLQFFTTDGNDSQAKQLTIDSDGDVTMHNGTLLGYRQWIVPISAVSVSTTSTELWMPFFKSKAEMANANDPGNRMLVPYAGYLEKMIIRGGNAAGNTSGILYKVSDGTDADDIDADDGSAYTNNVGSAVTVNMSSADTAYTFTYGSTYSFSAGDMLALTLNVASNAGDVDGVLVFRVNYS